MTEPALTDESARWVADRAAQVIEQVQRVYVGNQAIPEMLVIALLARGHVLLEGVPGVAKTTLAHAFARTLGCEFRRVQFTPDLLPADITGTYVLSPRDGTFQLRRGPIFSNVVLGDEINRAPAKTQSALLEAMQEGQVTIEGETYPLPDPFLVLATQNPVEHAGTYPLPEAQIDRFLMRLVIGYPEERDERAILKRFLGAPPAAVAVLGEGELRAMRDAVLGVHIDDELLAYVVRLTTHTRRHAQVFLGASPRAGLALVQSARARAVMDGRAFVVPDDVKSLAVAVLAHRIVLTPDAEMEGRSGEAIIEKALDEVSHRPVAV
jgi:MoxR-like ATPase